MQLAKNMDASGGDILMGLANEARKRKSRTRFLVLTLWIEFHAFELNLYLYL